MNKLFLNTIFFTFYSLLLFSQGNKSIVKINYKFQLNINSNQNFNSQLFVSKDEVVFQFTPNIDTVKVSEKQDENLNFEISVPTRKVTSTINLKLKERKIFEDLLQYQTDTTRIGIDTLQKIDWLLVNESKKIGEYECFKAKCNYKGRSYTAWYTLEIPVSYGPWKLNGLPGLILMAFEDNGMMYSEIQSIEYGEFNFITLNGKKQIKLSDLYKEIAKETAAKLQLSLQEAFGSSDVKMEISGFEVADIQTLERFNVK
jgi:GLPGLI family protein